MNPEYDADKLGLDLLTLDRPDMGYEFDTLIFVSTKDGRVFSASDSGCSCPKPFEDYEGANADEVTRKMERIGSVEQALSIFDSWNKGYGERPKLPISERVGVSDWIKARLGRVVE